MEIYGCAAKGGVVQSVGGYGWASMGELVDVSSQHVLES